MSSDLRWYAPSRASTDRLLRGMDLDSWADGYQKVRPSVIHCPKKSCHGIGQWTIKVPSSGMKQQYQMMDIPSVLLSLSARRVKWLNEAGPSKRDNCSHDSLGSTSSLDKVIISGGQKLQCSISFFAGYKSRPIRHTRSLRGPRNNRPCWENIKIT